MKKILLLVFCILVQTNSLVNAAAPKKHKKAGIAASLGVKASDCRKIEGFPTIVVCVEGDAGDGVFDEDTLRTLKTVTKNLIDKYQSSKEEGASTQEFIEEENTPSEDSNCHKIEGSPNINVCVTGDPGNATFDENALRVLKGTTKNLITKYKEKKIQATKKMSMASACGSMPNMATDPMGYMAWMACTAGAAITTTPPPMDPCMMTPNMPGCPGYVPPVTNTAPTMDPCMMTPNMPGCPGYVPPVTNTAPTMDPCMMTPNMPGCPGYVAPVATPAPTMDPCMMTPNMPGCPGYVAPVATPAPTMDPCMMTSNMPGCPGYVPPPPPMMNPCAMNPGMPGCY